MGTAYDLKPLSSVPLPRATTETSTSAVSGDALPCSSSGRRADGRGPEEMRPILIQVGVHSTAEGSAYVELGASAAGDARDKTRTSPVTKVMAAAFGPREADKSSLLSSSSSSSSFSFSEGRIAVDLRSTPFSGGRASALSDLGGASRSRARAQTVAERAGAAALASALAPVVLSREFPKLVVDVAVVVLEDGGSSLAAAALAAGAALADAGVAMSGVLGAAAVARVSGRIVLDPSSDEEASADARLGLIAVSTTSTSTTTSAADAPSPSSLPPTITQACFSGGGWTADGTEAALGSGAAAAAAAADAVRAALRSRAAAAAAEGGGGDGGKAESMV